MLYYVQKGTCFGKKFSAKTDGEAIAFAMGYAAGKDWKKDEWHVFSYEHQAIIFSWYGVIPLANTSWFEFTAEAVQESIKIYN